MKTSAVILTSLCSVLGEETVHSDSAKWQRIGSMRFLEFVHL